MIGRDAVGAVAIADEYADDQREAASSELKMWVVRIGVAVVILLAWQFASGTLVREFWLSKPTLVLARLGQWFSSGIIWINLYVTLEETILGFVTGTVTGFIAGLLLGQSRFFAKVFSPYIVAVNSLPKLALAPLLILWFGIGLPMKVVLAALIVFFLVFYNTFAGVLDVDRDLIDIIQTMGAKRRDILLKVIVPSALLWVFTGLRVSIPYALIGAVVGEIFASNQGIGYLIQRAGSQFDTAGTFAGLLVLTAVSTFFNVVLDAVERRVLRWKTRSA